MYTSYAQFLKQADEHFDRLTAKHASSFKCRQGCHACCEPGLTVLKVEAENIVRYIAQNPTVQQELRSIQTTNPHNGTRCSMLNQDGQCAIDPVRPFICRSHGAPIAIAREDYYQIDVCPLNFTENPIEELGPEDFFILDDWNDILCSTNDTDKRIALTSLFGSNIERG